MRLHLLDSNHKLTEGLSYPVLCGKLITHARFVFAFEGEITHFRDMLNPLVQCRKCVIAAEEKIVDGGEQGRSYWYGIVEAQEADRG